jgi:predicted component of type VI protein secretion system
MNILLSIRSTIDQSVREINCALDDHLVIGRGAEEGVLLDGQDLSREHFMLGTDGTNFYVTDLSSNGTWLNGTKLTRSARSRIRPEDSIEVPGYVLRFRLDGAGGNGEGALAQAPSSLIQASPTMTVPAATGALRMLDPVFRFIGSFGFMEKLLIVVGACGLLLFLFYLTS